MVNKPSDYWERRREQDEKDLKQLEEERKQEDGE